MRIPKKCQYALRAIFELGLHDPGDPVKIHEIADAQNIPPRFLEIIMNQLRHAGFVESRRGSKGGYMLIQRAGELTVGEILRYIQGPVSITTNFERNTNKRDSFYGDYAFEQLWATVNSAIRQVCENTTFEDLIEIEKSKQTSPVLNYSI